jgi:HSP20 family protein
MEDIGEFFALLFGRMHARREGAAGREALSVADWAPMVDITEDDKESITKAEIPEVDKNAVKFRFTTAFSPYKASVKG